MMYKHTTLTRKPLGGNRQNKSTDQHFTDNKTLAEYNAKRPRQMSKNGGKPLKKFAFKILVSKSHDLVIKKSYQKVL